MILFFFSAPSLTWPSGAAPTATGGGSAALLATYTVTPLDAITEAAAEAGASVDFALGATSHRYLPELDPFMSDAKIEFFRSQPHDDWLSETKKALPAPDFVLPAPSSIAFMCAACSSSS